MARVEGQFDAAGAKTSLTHIREVLNRPEGQPPGAAE